MKTKAMKNQATTGLVPKLRFPAFESAGDWTTEKLGTVATISTEKVGNNVCEPMSITSGVGLVSCWIPCDHIPARSWALFKARDTLRGVIESLRQEARA